MYPLSMVMSKNIYFGSLEDQLVNEIREEKQTETVQVPLNSQPQSQSQSQSNEEFDRRALARTLRIPTDDPSIRRLLIALNQPMTLFGEGPAERRDRLRLMASRAICSLPRALELFPVLKTLLGDTNSSEIGDSDDSESDSEEFYVPGSVDLIKIRSFLLEDSIKRSRERKPLDQVTEQTHRRALYSKVSGDVDLRASFVDPQGRPLSTCAFTRETGQLYTGDWSGRLMRYDYSTKTGSGGSGCLVKSVNERITAMGTDSGNGILFGTATGRIEYNDQVVQESTGQSLHAVKSLNWHPSGRFFASCSSDSLWKLWDAVTGSELQVQEGHLGGTGAGTWHPDGAIYCTGGSSDGVIRVWDCRLGKSVWNIPCRTGVAITSLVFAPLTPSVLASSDADGLVSLHDLRRVTGEYAKVAAHRSCCSAIRFTGAGRLLASSGFDGSVRLWCPGDLRLVKELPVAANTKVTHFDAWEEDAGGAIRIGAVTFDRSVKIFE